MARLIWLLQVSKRKHLAAVKVIAVIAMIMHNRLVLVVEVAQEGLLTMKTQTL